MRKFKPSFFLSASLCLFSVFFIGLSLTKKTESSLYQSLAQKSLKAESLWSFKQLEQKLDLLNQEAQKIQEEKKINSQSPFFAFVFLHSDKDQKVYRDKSYPVKLSQRDPASVDKKKQIKQKKPPKSAKKRKKVRRKKTKSKPIKKPKLVLSKEDKAFISLAQKTFKSQSQKNNFHFTQVKTENDSQVFTIVFKKLSQGAFWAGFFRKDKTFFKLSSIFEKTSQALLKNKTFFIINPEGKVFFHNRSSPIFKTFSKKSPAWPFFKELIQKTEDFSFKGKYIKIKSKKNVETIYYLQKWRDLFFISKAEFHPPFSIGKNVYMYLALLLFFITGAFFFWNVFSINSAYQFLKQAFLSFDKTGFFPSADGIKNPWLYFYGNRYLFVNKRKQEDLEDKKEEDSLTFQEVLKQELEKLKSRFPRLTVREQLDFDIKVFGFKKFLRSILYELLLNSLEAMGGLKAPRLDLSVKKVDDNLMFSVRDYGLGVSKQDYEKLFQLYYSTKSKTGMGLNLVQSLVQYNGGKIKLSSPKGGGLAVSVYLPLKCFFKNHSD